MRIVFKWKLVHGMCGEIRGEFSSYQDWEEKNIQNSVLQSALYAETYEYVKHEKWMEKFLDKNLS